MTDAREINWASEARELKHAIADNAYPAADGTADIDNHALPLIETTLRNLCERYVKSLHAAGYRILGPDEVQAIRDEALEEAAKQVEDEIVDIYEDSPDIDIECNNLVRRAAGCVRSLKGCQP